MPAQIVSNRVRVKDQPLSPQELEAWMNKEGIGIAEFADIIGVTFSAVTHWLSGVRGISITNSRLIRMFMKYPTLLKEF